MMRYLRRIYWLWRGSPFDFTTWWNGLLARLDALLHVLRGHDVHWRVDAEPWIGLTGDIVCKMCPDTNSGVGGLDLCIWMRDSALLRVVARWWCERRGHMLISKAEWRSRPGWNIVGKDAELACERCMWDESDYQSVEQ